MKLQFSLRDLVWTVVVVALACAWWLEHRSAAKAREHAYFLRQEYNLSQHKLRECMDYVNELEPPPNKLQGEWPPSPDIGKCCDSPSAGR